MSRVLLLSKGGINLPPKLDRCVKKLMKEGHSEQEAWAICRKQLKYDLLMEREKKKRLFTGQLIDKKHLFNKQKELEKELKEE